MIVPSFSFPKLPRGPSRKPTDRSNRKRPVAWPHTGCASWPWRATTFSAACITGDAKETALAIAKKCGIMDVALHEEVDEENIENALMNGKEIDDAGKDLRNRIAGVKVFYRVAPRHKLAIVRACT
jgi:hypothetical protein